MQEKRTSMPYTFRSIALHGTSCPEPLPATPTAACASTKFERQHHPRKGVSGRQTRYSRHSTVVYPHRWALEIVIQRSMARVPTSTACIGLKIQHRHFVRNVCLHYVLRRLQLIGFLLGNSMIRLQLPGARLNIRWLTRTNKTRTSKTSIAVCGATTGGGSATRTTALQPNRGGGYHPLSVVTVNLLQFRIHVGALSRGRGSASDAFVDVHSGVI